MIIQNRRKCRAREMKPGRGGRRYRKRCEMREENGSRKRKELKRPVQKRTSVLWLAFLSNNKDRKDGLQVNAPRCAQFLVRGWRSVLVPRFCRLCNRCVQNENTCRGPSAARGARESCRLDLAGFRTTDEIEISWPLQIARGDLSRLHQHHSEDALLGQNWFF
jgi:hypothetical protein